MPYTEEEIKQRINKCQKLASLRSISDTLSTLVNAENTYAAEIAEVIRADPTLTSRLLRLVNSVFFGLSYKVTNIEDAIFYLGIKQIRELALATPVIEDFKELEDDKVDWKDFWQHSIACAMVTRDILELINISSLDETDYILGLIHNVGKLVMAFVFSEDFHQVVRCQAATSEDISRFERDLIGWDHGQIGAYYLRRHEMPDYVIEAVEYHHRPEEAPKFKKVSAAVQLADVMVRSVGIQGIEDVEPIDEEDWKQLPSWDLVFDGDDSEFLFGLAALRHSLKRLPEIIKGIVSNEMA